MRGSALRRFPAATSVSVALIGGLVCGNSLGAPGGVIDASGAAALPLALCAVLGSRRASDFVLLASFACIGFARGGIGPAHWEASSTRVREFEGEAWVRGQLTPGDTLIDRPAVLRIREIRPIADSVSARLVCDIPVAARFGGATPAGDDPITIQGFIDLVPPRGARHPGGWSDVFGLRERGLAGVAWLESFVVMGAARERRDRHPAARVMDWVIGSAAHARRAWMRACARARAGLADHIRARLGGGEGEFAATYLLGARGARSHDDSVANTLKRAGLGHLLAVSGFHVTLLAGTFFFLLAMTPLSPRQRWAILALLLVLYAELVGWSASVGRATFAGAVWAALRAAGRKPRPLTLLISAAAVALYLRPEEMRRPGFQLSYLVTLALICGAGSKPRGGPNRRADPDARRRPRKLRDRVAAYGRGMLPALGAAQLAAWPLTLAHFGSASLIHPLANAVILPFAGAITPALIAGFTLDALPHGPGDLALASPRLLVTLTLAAARAAAEAADEMRVAAPLPVWLAVALAVLVALCLRVRAARLPARFTAALVMIAGATFGAAQVNPLPRVFMLDVGQGESWLILWPRETWVYDLGPPPRTAGRPRDCLPAALNYFGRSTIERLFLSHADSDHIGGYQELGGSGVSVKSVHHPCDWTIPETFRSWLDSLEVAGAHVGCVSEGDEFTTRAGHAVVISPPLVPSRGDDNARSLAMVVTAGRARILICGDAEADMQSAWVALGRVPLVDVISAAHHGGVESTPAELTRACRPRAVVASVGRRNRYGHPSRCFRERICAARLPLYRTDRLGTLEIDTQE